MQLCDLPVLMGYDSGTSPEAYGKTVTLLFQDFAAAAAANQTNFMIGLPFIATHLEYEYKISRQSGTREETGFSMAAYLSEGLKVIEEIKSADGFVGVCIWAGLGGPIGGKTEAYRWYPYEISEQNWEMLAKFNF